MCIDTFYAQLLCKYCEQLERQSEPLNSDRDNYWLGLKNTNYRSFSLRRFGRKMSHCFELIMEY
jgi:hypothetical protein